MKKSAPIFSLITLLFSACSSPDLSYLEREDLFQLSLGMMEDELVLFRQEAQPFPQNNHIFMRDGRFFISNANAAKVMEFTSYGDIVSLHYDPEKNPEPVALSRSGSNGPSSNRLAWEYPFREINQIGVNSRNDLFVVDRILKDRRLFDEDRGIYLDRVIHRFNSAGSYREFLGQEGVGGAPFPYIEDFYVTARDELVVVCRMEMDRRIFWYSPRGELLYQIELPWENAPLADEFSGMAPSLEKIYPDQDERLLYLKLSFYKALKDEQTGVQSGISYEGSQIAVLDVPRGEYQQWIELPANVVSHQGTGLFEEARMEYPFQMVGTASGGHLFFLGSREDDFHELLVLDRRGRIAVRQEIFIEDSQLIARDFHVAASGLLTAFLSHSAGARIVWWRSDRLLDIHQSRRDSEDY